MPAKFLGKITIFLFPADLDENDSLRSSCREVDKSVQERKN